MKVHLEVATSDIQPSRDLQAHILAGYMHKLGQSSFMRLWKKRYFVLRQDGCLYYYKHKEVCTYLLFRKEIVVRHLYGGFGVRQYNSCIYFCCLIISYFYVKMYCFSA